MSRTLFLAAVALPLTLPAVASTQSLRPHTPRIVHASTTTSMTGAISDEQFCMDQLGVSRRELDENDREDAEFEPIIDRCIATMHQNR